MSLVVAEVVGATLVDAKSVELVVDAGLLLVLDTASIKVVVASVDEGCIVTESVDSNLMVVSSSAIKVVLVAVVVPDFGTGL